MQPKKRRAPTVNREKIHSFSHTPLKIIYLKKSLEMRSLLEAMSGKVQACDWRCDYIAAWITVRAWEAAWVQRTSHTPANGSVQHI